MKWTFDWFNENFYARPLAIQLSLFLFIPALQNELDEEIKKELTAFAAPKKWMNEN